MLPLVKFKRLRQSADHPKTGRYFPGKGGAPPRPPLLPAKLRFSWQNFDFPKNAFFFKFRALGNRVYGVFDPQKPSWDAGGVIYKKMKILDVSTFSAWSDFSASSVFSHFSKMLQIEVSDLLTMWNRSGMVNFIPFTLTRTRENHSWCLSWENKVSEIPAPKKNLVFIKLKKKLCQTF